MFESIKEVNLLILGCIVEGPWRMFVQGVLLGHSLVHIIFMCVCLQALLPACRTG